MFWDYQSVLSLRFKMSRKTFLGSRQPAYTLYILDKLTVTDLVWWELIFRGVIA